MTTTTIISEVVRYILEKEGPVVGYYAKRHKSGDPSGIPSLDRLVEDHTTLKRYEKTIVKDQTYRSGDFLEDISRVITLAKRCTENDFLAVGVQHLTKCVFTNTLVEMCLTSKSTYTVADRYQYLLELIWDVMISRFPDSLETVLKTTLVTNNINASCVIDRSIRRYVVERCILHEVDLFAHSIVVTRKSLPRGFERIVEIPLYLYVYKYYMSKEGEGIDAFIEHTSYLKNNNILASLSEMQCVAISSSCDNQEIDGVKGLVPCFILCTDKVPFRYIVALWKSLDICLDEPRTALTDTVLHVIEETDQLHHKKWVAILDMFTPKLNGSDLRCREELDHFDGDPPQSINEDVRNSSPKNCSNTDIDTDHFETLLTKRKRSVKLIVDLTDDNEESIGAERYINMGFDTIEYDVSTYIPCPLLPDLTHEDIVDMNTTNITRKPIIEHVVTN